MATVVCYKDNKTGEEYLSYYTYKTPEEAKKEVDKINKEKPEKLWNGEPAFCDERTYFVDEQEEMY